MAANESDSAFIDAAENEKLSDLSTADSAPEEVPQRLRLFNVQRYVHDVFGRDMLADIIFWRRKCVSAGVLVGSTLAWAILEKSGYTLLSIVSNVLLIFIIGFFVWANAAVFIHIPPPRIPELHLSEDMVVNFASALRMKINKALAVAHDIALGKDMKVFLKVVAVLWGLSIVGGWFHLLTLVYICIVISLTVPVIHEKYEVQIDSFFKLIMDRAHKHFLTLNDAIAKKFPKSGFKEKKVQ